MGKCYECNCELNDDNTSYEDFRCDVCVEAEQLEDNDFDCNEE